MAARIIAVIVILIVGGIIAYPYVRHYFERPPMPSATAPAAPAEARPTGPRFPIEAPAKPLPKLNESDPAVAQSLTELFDAKTVQRFFNVEDFIRRIVATVDNLPSEKIAGRLNPVKPVEGKFATAGRGEALAIGPANASRYDPALRLFESVDTPKLVETYRYFYPLFQQAYVELGYPNGYFNDRLVEVIDHLLDAPEPKGPVRLVQPKVLYQFADPDLEALSAGQKMMIRMGPQHEARVKAKLKELRAALVK